MPIMPVGRFAGVLQVRRILTAIRDASSDHFGTQEFVTLEVSLRLIIARAHLRMVKEIKKTKGGRCASPRLQPIYVSGGLELHLHVDQGAPRGSRPG